MTDLNFDIIDGVVDEPYFMTIYGPGGVGKSWFASNAEKPLFIPVEQGVNKIPVKKYNTHPKTSDEFFAMFKHAIQQKTDDVKTIVIDSAGPIQSMFYVDIINKEPEIVTKNGKKTVESINDYPFGHGYAKAMAYWDKVIAGVKAAHKTGKNVILITHSHLKNVTNEGGESYKKIDMELQSFGDYKVPELLKRWSDYVLYMESKVQTRKVKGKFGGESIVPLNTTPDRIIYTRETNMFFAKCRCIDESAVQDAYDLEKENYKQIFNEIVRG